MRALVEEATVPAIPTGAGWGPRGGPVYSRYWVGIHRGRWVCGVAAPSSENHQARLIIFPLLKADRGKGKLKRRHPLLHEKFVGLLVHSPKRLIGWETTQTASFPRFVSLRAER